MEGPHCRQHAHSGAKPSVNMVLHFWVPPPVVVPDEHAINVPCMYD